MHIISCSRRCAASTPRLEASRAPRAASPPAATTDRRRRDDHYRRRRRRRPRLHPRLRSRLSRDTTETPRGCLHEIISVDSFDSYVICPTFNPRKRAIASRATVVDTPATNISARARHCVLAETLAGVRAENPRETIAQSTSSPARSTIPPAHRSHHRHPRRRSHPRDYTLARVATTRFARARATRRTAPCTKTRLQISQHHRHASDGGARRPIGATVFLKTRARWPRWSFARRRARRRRATNRHEGHPSVSLGKKRFVFSRRTSRMSSRTVARATSTGTRGGARGTPLEALDR